MSNHEDELPEDTLSPRAQELLDKYYSKTLTADEERELSTLSLQENALFDLLAIDGMLQEFLEQPQVREILSPEPEI